MFFILCSTKEQKQLLNMYGFYFLKTKTKKQISKTKKLKGNQRGPKKQF